MIDVYKKDKIKYLERNFLEADEIYGTTEEILEKFEDDDLIDENLYDSPNNHYADKPIDEYLNLEVLVCDKINNLKIEQLKK